MENKHFSPKATYGLTDVDGLPTPVLSLHLVQTLGGSHCLDVRMHPKVVLLIRENGERELFRPVFLRTYPVGCKRGYTWREDSATNELSTIYHESLIALLLGCPPQL